jgi:hypothetical protein
MKAGEKGCVVKPFYAKEFVAPAHRLIPHCTVGGI